MSPYVNGRSFDPETVKCMGAAFERACDQLGLKADQLDPFTEMVAKRVITLTTPNERDPAALTARVLTALRNDRCITQPDTPQAGFAHADRCSLTFLSLPG
jgi:hypothetical protein